MFTIVKGKFAPGALVEDCNDKLFKCSKKAFGP